MSYLRDHVTATGLKDFFRSVLLDGPPLSSDQSQGAVRRQDIDGGHNFCRWPGGPWDVLLWKLKIPGAFFSKF